MQNKIKLKGKLRRFLQWPLYLSILLIALNLLVYTEDKQAGMLMTLGVAVYVLIALMMFFLNQPMVLKELIGFASQYDQVEKRMIDELLIPYVLMDEMGKLIWMNKSFMELTGLDESYKKTILGVFPEFPQLEFEEITEPKTFEMTFMDRDYRATVNKLSLDNMLEESNLIELDGIGTFVISMSLVEVSELNEYIKKHDEEKLVTGLIYLDNYEEALESVEEVRRSLLVALIDRKITKYFSNIDGLVKKIEKDKYFLIMRKRSLDTLQQQRFGILEDVKTVNIGNEMAVTLSVGIGLNAPSYAQNYEYARIAIEMALGRGGDQVVVKDDNRIQYFGGKSQQMEKTTRVKARVKAQALKEFISSKDKVVVMGHKITDVDAFGAAIGIYRAAKTLGKPAHIVINDPTTSIKPLMAGFLESADYESDMFVSSHEAKNIVDNNTVLIVVDTNKPSYTECKDLLALTKTIVVMDHHRRGSEAVENAVLSYIEPYASSTCEMVAEILQYFSEGIRIRNIEADSIYAGIMIDTNNYTTKTGVRTFEAAAFLRRCGADVTRVRKMLRDDMESYKARAEAIRSSEIYKDCYAIAQCPSKGLESPTITCAQAANELLNIVGVKASFVLTVYNDVVYISARAIDEVNVQIIMERLGGGGHMNIAGAQVEHHTEAQAIDMLKAIIDEMSEEGDI